MHGTAIVTGPSSGTSLAEITRRPEPNLRYRSGEFPRSTVAQRPVDITADTIVAGTSMLLRSGAPRI